MLVILLVERHSNRTGVIGSLVSSAGRYGRLVAFVEASNSITDCYTSASVSTAERRQITIPLTK